MNNHATVAKDKNDPIPLPTGSGQSHRDWESQLQLTKNGNVKSNAFNTLLIFNNDENLKGKFAFNLLNKSPEIVGSVPWKRTSDTSEITPNDEACLRNYLSINYGIQSRSIIEDALNQVVLDNQFHPIRDYFESIRGTWDGKPRVDTLLIDFFDADDTELNRWQTRLTLVGAIKRIFQPGCKFDFVLTLKGGQGLGKSTFFLEISVKPEWFSDSLDDLKGKDAKQQLTGNWIIELGEMAAVSKKDQKNIKQFIASRVDDYRPPYGKRNIKFARQNIFVASTNDEMPLKDDTGGRRFWIVEVKSRWFEKDFPLEVDQIWAEALEIYERMEANEEPLKLPNHLEEEAQKIQHENTDRGLFAPEIEQALEQGYYYKHNFETGRKEKVEFTRTCAKHVWENVLKRHMNDLTSTTAREINATLKNMPGWKCVGRKQFDPYGKQTIYEREDT